MWPAVCNISYSPISVCAAVAATQGLLEDLHETCRGCSAALTAAVAFLDSRQLGMVSLLDRQAKELLLQVQVSAQVEEWGCDGMAATTLCALKSIAASLPACPVLTATAAYS